MPAWDCVQILHLQWVLTKWFCHCWNAVTGTELLPPTVPPLSASLCPPTRAIKSRRIRSIVLPSVTVTEKHGPELESLWKLLSEQQRHRQPPFLTRLIECCRLRGIKIIVIENMTRCGGKECVMSCHCKGTPTFFFIVCRSFVGFLSFLSCFLLGRAPDKSSFVGVLSLSLALVF